VRIEYECNGCQFHKIDVDEESETGMKWHACHHPAVIEEYKHQQWMQGAKDLTLYHIARTPSYLCPYLAEAID